LSTRARVDAFEIWLQTACTPEQAAVYNRSIVEGFIAVAGPDPVTHEHIAISVSLARDAGIDVTAMEQLGKLIVEYDSSGDPAMATPPRAASEPPVQAKKVAKPLMMSFRDDANAPPAGNASTNAMAAFKANVANAANAPERARSAADDEPSAIINSVPRAATAPVAAAVDRAGSVDGATAASATRRVPKWAIPAAVVVVVGAGVAFAVFKRPNADKPAEPTAPIADHLRRVPQLALDAEFPQGWKVASDAGSAIVPNTAVVFRGDSEPDPDQAVFLAALPLADDLAAGIDITDAVLLAAAHDAEVGAAAHVTATGGLYETEGCVLSIIGQHTAVCRGEAKQRGQTMALRTYLRVGATRAVIALFIAKSTVKTATKDAEQIVRSFKL
jgi:hypothetical protein